MNDGKRYLGKLEESALGVKIEKHKCFEQSEQGFEKILPVNVLIGQNNVGKSALLDAIALACGSAGSAGASPVRYEVTLTQEVVCYLPEGSPRATWWPFIGSKFKWGRDGGSIRAHAPREGSGAELPWGAHLAGTLGEPFSGKRLYRLDSSRDIRREPSGYPLAWKPDGSGVTSAIRSFINRELDAVPKSRRRESMAAFVDALNQIIGGKAVRRVDVFENHSGEWELHLDEYEKKASPIPLSDSGAGLKTVLCVLTAVLLRPIVDNTEVNNCIFAFEEPENNLHPAIQRRLLAFLRRKAVDEGATLFLSTHSSVAIDTFQNDEHAQLIHVQREAEGVCARVVETRSQGRGILDDLDVRASDLLQANCLVWLEGPSDRRYFNRWIEAFSEGQLREGAHYQCVFYGGSVLSHFAADDEATPPAVSRHAERFVNILTLSRHSIIMLDSDRQHEGEPLDATKERVIEQVQTAGGYAWVTLGREVENYVPVAVWADFAGLDTEQCGQFADIPKAWGNNGKLGVRSLSKVELASRILDKLTKEQLTGHLDLAERMGEVIAKIREWNGLRSEKG